MNANSVLLFSTTAPSRDGGFLTPAILSRRLEEINNTLCPITYDPIPLRNAMISNAGKVTQDVPILRPGVFPSCGHVFQLPPPQINNTLKSCPTCRHPGHMIPLLLQTAPTFLRVDATFTNVIPCGHAFSDELARRMSAVALPTNDFLIDTTEAREWANSLSGRRRRCWFCGAGFFVSEVRKLYLDTEGATEE